MIKIPIKKNEILSKLKLRKAAETKIDKLDQPIKVADTILSNEEAKQLLYDLRLHQVELEMQNEELRLANQKLEIARTEYYDIFETAPVSYCTIDKDGVILESNLSMSIMLGYTRKALNASHLNNYVLPQDVGMYQRNLALLFVPTEIAKFDLRLISKKQDIIWVRIAMKCGVSAQDKLIARVVLQDITQVKAQEKSLLFLSYHDQLTGLYNRRFFEEELRRMDTQRQLPLSLILADLNGLKLVNDGYGHHFGDLMIQKAAEVFTHVCRDEDVIARWGGDEYIILLPKTSERDALIIADRIKSLAKNTLVSDLPISLAIGIGTKVDINEQTESIFTKAEDAMYFNKLLDHHSSRSLILNNFSNELMKRSIETKEHIEEMSLYASKFGKKLGLLEAELNRLEVIVRLHDIGNVNLPDYIFKKTDSLTKEEWDLVRKHCRVGYNIVVLIPELTNIAQEILNHHERWDGSGYPQGLRQLEIPFLARIISIVDAYMVMKNGRPYKVAMNYQMIIEEFTQYSGTQFDPDLVPVFLEILKESNEDGFKLNNSETIVS
ncbi:MAG: diguanylate cyclase [Erysipelotrichaceae bacterium]